MKTVVLEHGHAGSCSLRSRAGSRTMRRTLMALLASAACGGDGSTGDAATVDPAPFELGPAPSALIRPVAGELTLIQLQLPASSIGESAIVVGPDGAIVLIDVGNTSHDDDVRAEVERLNTDELIPGRGFAARTARQVDWIVLTHLHGDHIGAMTDLFTSGNPIELTHGVVHRGFVDLGDGMNVGDYEDLCALMRGSLAALDAPLCSAVAQAACTWDSGDPVSPATGCAGLRRGDLSRTDDDDGNVSSFIDLGGGARLTLVGADGHFADATGIAAMTPWPNSTGDDENARSVVGVISLGAFRYYFGGDLHGRANDGPDVESFFAQVSAPVILGVLGGDVIHAHHHARRTSSNPTFVGVTAPVDGRARNVVAGVNPAYLGSPYAETLTAWESSDRLLDGRIWLTDTTLGGATSPRLSDAMGRVIVQTIQTGRGYWVQAAGPSPEVHGYRAVRD